MTSCNGQRQLPKPHCRCYCKNMEELERLESCVDNLLNRLDSLKEENALLRKQVEELSSEKLDLAEKNQSLQVAMRNAEQRKSEILRRIDGLLQKIFEHDSIG